MSLLTFVELLGCMGRDLLLVVASFSCGHNKIFIIPITFWPSACVIFKSTDNPERTMGVGNGNLKLCAISEYFISKFLTYSHLL